MKEEGGGGEDGFGVGTKDQLRMLEWSMECARQEEDRPLASTSTILHSHHPSRRFSRTLFRPDAVEGPTVECGGKITGKAGGEPKANKSEKKYTLQGLNSVVAVGNEWSTFTFDF